MDTSVSQSDSPRSVFPGFRVPENKWYKVPNEWTDITSEIKSLAELKVIEYVMRHTWGFKGDTYKMKKITVEEFMHGRVRRNGTRIDKGTGLSEFGVKDGIKRALEHSYLLFYEDARDKGRIKKYYGLRILGVQYQFADEEDEEEEEN